MLVLRKRIIIKHIPNWFSSVSFFFTDHNDGKLTLRLQLSQSATANSRQRDSTLMSSYSACLPERILFSVIVWQSQKRLVHCSLSDVSNKIELDQTVPSNDAGTRRYLFCSCFYQTSKTKTLNRFWLQNLVTANMV